MPIDWFTVGAQAFNFLLLVALLRIFLYRPILDAMDRREEKIASRLEEAERQRDEAERERRAMEGQRRDLEEQKESLMAEAKEEAGKHRGELVESARREVEAAKDEWLHQIDEEREGFLRDLRRRIAGEVCALARKALKDLADAELEEQATRQFLAKLEREWKNLGVPQRANGVRIRSAFDLPEASRGRLREALAKLLDGDRELRFETSGELLCGIEVTVGDRKIAWSLDDYLSAFENRLSETLDRK